MYSRVQEYSSLSRTLTSPPPRLRVEHKGGVERMQELVDGEEDCAVLPSGHDREVAVVN